MHHCTYQRRGFECTEDVGVLCREYHERHHRRLGLSAVRATEHEPITAPMVSSSEIRWLKKT
jgi:hypothetical protein